MSEQQTPYIGIDPGTTHSGWARIGEKSVWGGVDDNGAILGRIAVDWLEDWLDCVGPRPIIAIERLRGSGRAVGFETIQTIEWVGRFVEAHNQATGQLPLLLTRHEVLKALGLTRGTGTADSRVRAKMVEIYGEPGSKSKPGATYGITGHAWQALAVAHVAKMRG
jgi:hypothetical protein